MWVVYKPVQAYIHVVYKPVHVELRWAGHVVPMEDERIPK